MAVTVKPSPRIVDLLTKAAPMTDERREEQAASLTRGLRSGGREMADGSETKEEETMQTVATSETVQAKQGNDDDAEYDAFLARVQKRFTGNVEGGKVPLFTTDAHELWAAYLDSFGPAPAEGEPVGVERQYHTCNACRRFIERFGGLVTIDSEGRIASAIWDEADAPEHYKPAVAAMARLVRRAKVTGVFVSSEIVWGTPETGTWRHFAVVPPVSTIWNSRTQKAHERRAEKGQDYGAVRRALGELSLPNVELALTLLKTDALYRSEKVLGQADSRSALSALAALRISAGSDAGE